MATYRFVRVVFDSSFSGQYIWLKTLFVYQSNGQGRPSVQLTSNTTPFPYIAAASSEFSAGWQAWKAFNLTQGDWSTVLNGDVNSWLQIDLGNETFDPFGGEIRINPGSTADSPTGFRVLLSNSGAFAGEEFTALTVTGLLQMDWTVGVEKIFKFSIEMAGNASGNAQANADLSIIIDGSASSNAQANADLSANSGIGLAGSSDAQSSSAGALNAEAPIQGDASAQAESSGNIFTSADTTLEGAAASDTRTDGNVDAHAQLSAAVQANASSAGQLFIGTNAPAFIGSDIIDEIFIRAIDEQIIVNPLDEAIKVRVQ